MFRRRANRAMTVQADPAITQPLRPSTASPEAVVPLTRYPLISGAPGAELLSPGDDLHPAGAFQHQSGVLAVPLDQFDGAAAAEPHRVEQHRFVAGPVAGQTTTGVFDQRANAAGPDWAVPIDQIADGLQQGAPLLGLAFVQQIAGGAKVFEVLEAVAKPLEHRLRLVLHADHHHFSAGPPQFETLAG